jgi:hypothetical protein
MQDGDVIIYTNYFGIKDKYVEYLVNKYGDRLIVDNAQSFYSKHYKGISTVYSPRKFVGVPDGGIAYIDNPVQLNYQQDKSFGRCRHLLRRYDETASQGYSDFRVSEESLDNREIMLMSNLTKVLLRNVDFYFVKKRRTQNFEYLHKKIGKDNKLKIDMNSIECPLVYPFYTDNVNLRKQLISNKIPDIDVVEKFLFETKDEFNIPLDQVVDIKLYALKLHKDSEFFLCYNDDNIVAMINCYMKFRCPTTHLKIKL